MFIVHYCFVEITLPIKIVKHYISITRVDGYILKLICVDIIGTSELSMVTYESNADSIRE